MIHQTFTLRVSFDNTWEDVLGVGSVRMDPAVPLLYNALEHDVLNFVDFREKKRIFQNASLLPKQYLLITMIEAHLI